MFEKNQPLIVIEQHAASEDAVERFASLGLGLKEIKDLLKIDTRDFNENYYLAFRSGIAHRKLALHTRLTEVALTSKNPTILKLMAEVELGMTTTRKVEIDVLPLDKVSDDELIELVRGVDYDED